MSGGYIYEYWPGTELLKSWTIIDDQTNTPEGWHFVGFEDGPPGHPVESPAQQEASAFTILDSKQRQATIQISAIQSRIDAINDAISFERALPEEVAELPVRTAQLKVWKDYRIDLGRVTTISGWYQTPDWPITPAPFTSEMSASAPEVA